MTSPSTIIVDVALHQGWYIATSKSLTGLFVAHRNVAEFFQEIPAVIKSLIKVKCGVEVEVEEAPQPDARNLEIFTYVAEPKAAA